MTRSAFLLSLLATTGCAGDVIIEELEPACPPGHVETEDGCQFDEEAIVDLMTRFDDGTLVKVNRVEFEQVLGPRYARNVWIAQLPVDSLVEPSLDTVGLYSRIDPEDFDAAIDDVFPYGTVIVHENVDRIEGHTVQVKIEGHDDGFGREWWFGKYFDDGTADEDPCSPCTTCHTDTMRPDTEGLYGVPRDAL